MSDDLISRSALIEKATRNDIYGMVDIKDIEEMPTAYNVDKVVEQLKKEITKEDDIPVIQKTWNIAIKRAIEIVKAGGVNE